MPKHAKPLVGTWYAIRDEASGKFCTAGVWMHGGGALVFIAPEHLGTFPQAYLYRARPKVGAGYEIIDVRCRALSPRTKASKKRTK